VQLSFGRTHRRLRNALVVIELSLTVILLTGAGLMVHSFDRLMKVDPGFNLQGTLTARISLVRRYATPEQQTAFFDQLLQRLQSTSGVEAATLVSSLPLTPHTMQGMVQIEEHPAPHGVRVPVAMVIATTGYFHTMQIPILAGRAYDDHDIKTAPQVAVVNQAFVNQFFPGENAIGKRIRMGRPDAPWTSIVGVAGDVRHLGLDQTLTPEILLPYTQALQRISPMALAIRSQMDPGAMAATLRREVKALDSGQPVFAFTTMEHLLAESVSSRKFNTILWASFAMLALALATVGIYGVMSYSVAQRSHEIGIRMALGSNQGRVLKLVLSEAIILALCGVGLGITGALALTRYMASLLFAVKASDPLTMVSVSLLLIAVGALAGYMPAHRASRVDPMVVLRHE
jgi:putative ABC transport system permease protein